MRIAPQVLSLPLVAAKPVRADKCLIQRYHWKFHRPTGQPGRWCVR